MTLAKPVLVTGAPRSGTTWVGRMLTTSSQLYYVHEPFNPDYRPGSGICGVKFKHHQTYITQANEKEFYKPIMQMVEGKYSLSAALLSCRSIPEIKAVWNQKREFQEYNRRHMLPLIKDPIALMSAGWLGSRFDINVVVMIRHPAAFVASMKRLNWGFDPSRWALSQPLLLRDYLSPIEGELTLLKNSKSDIIVQTALLWKVLYSVVLKYKNQYPEWSYLRHEDLSRDPLDKFKQLFKTLGLEFTDEVQEQIVEYSNESNPSHSTGVDKLLRLNSKKVISYWKKALSAQEVMRIKEIVRDISQFFYLDSDWELDDISE